MCDLERQRPFRLIGIAFALACAQACVQVMCDLVRQWPWEGSGLRVIRVSQLWLAGMCTGHV